MKPCSSRELRTLDSAPASLAFVIKKQCNRTSDCLTEATLRAPECWREEVQQSLRITFAFLGSGLRVERMLQHCYNQLRSARFRHWNGFVRLAIPPKSA